MERLPDVASRLSTPQCGVETCDFCLGSIVRPVKAPSSVTCNITRPRYDLTLMLESLTRSPLHYCRSLAPRLSSHSTRVSSCLSTAHSLTDGPTFRHPLANPQKMEYKSSRSRLPEMIHHHVTRAFSSESRAASIIHSCKHVMIMIM